MKRTYVDIAEGQIHYRTEGSGEPLLMLHQTALSSEEYSDVIPILGKYYRVVAMDTIGYGNSDQPPHRYRMKDYVRTIIHFLDALNIAKTNVVGQHTGAAFAVELAAAYPERVDKLVFSGCPHIAKEARQAWLSHPRYKPMEFAADGSHITEWWKYYSGRWPDYQPEMMQRILANYLRADLGRGAVAAYWAIYQHDIEARLTLIKSPVLYITTPGDTFFDIHETTMKLIPRCRNHVIQGGHDHLAWEKSTEFAQAILDFLSNPGV